MLLVNKLLKSTKKYKKKYKPKKQYSNFTNKEVNNLIIEIQKNGSQESLEKLIEWFKPKIESYVKLIFNINYNKQGFFYKSTAKNFYNLFLTGKVKNYEYLHTIFKPILENFTYNDILNEFIIIFIEKIVYRYDLEIGYFEGYFYNFFKYWAQVFIKNKINELKKRATIEIPYKDIYNTDNDLSEDELIEKVLMVTNNIVTTKKQEPITDLFLLINDKNFIFNPSTRFEKQFTFFERQLIYLRFIEGNSINDLVNLLNINKAALIDNFKTIKKKILEFYSEDQILNQIHKTKHKKSQRKNKLLY